MMLMYNVSSTYKTKIRQSGREFEFACTIDASEEINLTKDDVLRFERFFNCGADIELGGVYPVGYKLTFANPGGLYSEVNFGGGTIDPSVGIKISGSPEYIAYNTGYIAARPKPTSTIELLAYDGLYKLNVPYVSTLSYPATLLEIAEDIASSEGLTLASANFTNKSAVVQSKPDFTGLTKTQVLSWVAQLAGSFARLNIYGQIEFCWYDTVGGNPITTDHCRKMVIDKPIAPISGVIYGDLIAGTDDNAIEIKDNFLLENITDKATVLSNINTRINGTTYYPYDIEWVGDFAYQPGDRIKIVDRDEVEYDTILMQDTLTLTTGLKCVSSAKTKTEEQKNYVSGTGVKTAKLRQQIKELDMKVDEQRSSLEVAIEDAANLMARSMNCYTFTKQAGDGWIAGTYLSFVPEEEADTETEVWVQSASGFAHYPNGVSGVPDIGMSASGTLVAKLVAAGIITADMVKTGILQNEDGSVHINLNTGEVRFTGKVDIKVGKSETLDMLAKDLRKIIEPGPFSGFNLTSEFIDVLARDINIYGMVTFHALDKSLQNQVLTFEEKGNLLEALTLIEDDTTVINGGLIATNTILGKSIIAGEITANHLSADAITAEKINISDLKELDATLSGWILDINAITGVYSSFATILRIPTNSGSVVFQSGTLIDPAFKVYAHGGLDATNANIKGSVKATSFEVLNSSGVKIGGMYGSGTTAYLAAGRLANPANVDAAWAEVGAISGDVHGIKLFSNKVAITDKEFLRLYAVEGVDDIEAHIYAKNQLNITGKNAMNIMVTEAGGALRIDAPNIYMKGYSVYLSGGYVRYM